MNKKGVALIFALAVVTILAVLATVTVSRSVNEGNIAQRYLSSTQAFWAAEAGVQKAIYALNHSDWAGWADAGSGVKLKNESLSSGSGAFLVTVSGIGTGTPSVAVGGSSGSAARNLQVKMVAIGGSPFKYAAFGASSVALSGNAKIDSYNSDLGPYGGINKYSNGDVGTNAVSAGAITLSGNAKVYGDAGTGSGGTVVTNGNAAVIGSVTDDRNETLAPVIIPSGLSGLSSGGSLSKSGNNSFTLSGSHKYTSLSVSGNAQITISGKVELYLTGSNALSISGNGKIIIPSGGELLIYSDGVCIISGNGVVNQTSLPKNMLIYSTYTGNNGVSFSGNSNLHAAIYAPGTGISNTGNSDIYGSVIGKKITVSGNGGIHYDEALANLGGTASNYSIEGWQEETNPFPLVSE